MTHSPTEEQAAIFQAALTSKTSLQIRAYAGCGKTSTLEMLSHQLSPVPALALAFNVKIKKELEARLPDWFTVKTFNGLGHAAWNKAISKSCELDERKIGKLVTETAKLSRTELSTDQWSAIKDAVNKARASGLIPSKFTQFKSLVPDTHSTWADFFDEAEPTEALLDFARSVLVRSIEKSFEGKIDYDDQIYMSSLFNGSYPKFDLVLVDEAQDLSPLNHRQVQKVAGHAGRLIVVGDPKQAIYAFRGADSKSMDRLEALRPEWITLPLATTFRCPKAIVSRQTRHAEGFKAFSSAPEGQILQLPAPDQTGWTWDEIKALREPGEEIAILCRNNAPIVKLAFRLIRSGTGCKMLGRDIGKGLEALAKKLCAKMTDTATAIRAINSWKNSEISLAEANDKPEKIAGITDRAECLIAVLEGGLCDSPTNLVPAIKKLFDSEHGITLSSIHRSKGLEWPLVIHLDPWRIPSKYAKQEGGAALEQEHNLQYVAETRAKRVLILANLEDFKSGDQTND